MCWDLYIRTLTGFQEAEAVAWTESSDKENLSEEQQRNVCASTSIHLYMFIYVIWEYFCYCCII